MKPPRPPWQTLDKPFTFPWRGLYFTLLCVYHSWPLVYFHGSFRKESFICWIVKVKHIPFPRLHCFALHFLHSVCVSQMEKAVSPPPHHPEPTVSFRFTPLYPWNETKRCHRLCLHHTIQPRLHCIFICSFIHARKTHRNRFRAFFLWETYEICFVKENAIAGLRMLKIHSGKRLKR